MDVRIWAAHRRILSILWIGNLIRRRAGVTKTGCRGITGESQSGIIVANRLFEFVNEQIEFFGFAIKRLPTDTHNLGRPADYAISLT